MGGVLLTCLLRNLPLSKCEQIQLFTSVQMQPLAVRLCNDHIHPLGPDILWEAKVKGKTLISE